MLAVVVFVGSVVFVELLVGMSIWLMKWTKAREWQNITRTANMIVNELRHRYAPICKKTEKHWSVHIEFTACGRGVEAHVAMVYGLF